jgi:hypothetical protein
MRKHYIYTALIHFFIFTSLSAEEWTVPQEKNTRVSPFKFSSETVKKGEILFKQNCTSCHGTPGKGNFVALVPAPGDPATDKFQKQTDGALFFKMTTGRSPMPSFKDVLTDVERWNIISFFRSYNSKYVQPEPVVAPSGKFSGLTISVTLSYLALQKQIKLIATSVKDSVKKPIEGLNMILFAKRYFGTMQIDETKTTNEKGEAFYYYTDSLPGDSIGNITFIASSNTDGLSDFKELVNLKIGKPTKVKSILEQRAMWGVRSKAPVWLIVSYSLVVICVWSVLIYIALQIRKIYFLGKKKI